MQNLNNDDFKKYVALPTNFNLVVILPHQETAWRKKIFPYISKSMIESFETTEDESEKEIFELIKKAAACYTVVLAIPSLKVSVNTFGLKTFEDGKMKNAEWYNIRDLGLSLVKTADECLSDAITAIGKIPALKSECPFFINYSYAPIPTPEEFNLIYNINKSIDVYLQLVPIMQRVWRFSIEEKLKNCTISQISSDAELSAILNDSLVYFSLSEALEMSQFTFITSGLVIQYEELPWQKSVILSHIEKINLTDKFSKLASLNLGWLLKYIKDRPEDFPCYQPEITTSEHKIIEKKSGLYL